MTRGFTAHDVGSVWFGPVFALVIATGLSPVWACLQTVPPKPKGNH